MRLIALAVSLFVFSACENGDCNFEIAADQIRFADSLEKNGKTYLLYTRTVGFQEKVVFFELYDKRPEFVCRQPDIEPIYIVDYADYPDKQYIKKLTVQPDQAEKLDIEYTKRESEGSSVYEAKFTLEK